MTTNWAGNHDYPVEPVRPTSEDELAEILRIAQAQRRSVRALGSRHSFNAIADAEVMIDLSGLPEVFKVDSSREFVRISAAMTFGRLAELLEPEGLALHNMASLPHISVAGAIATGTHGSGMTNQNLAGGALGFDVFSPDGTHESFHADWIRREAAVHLGALGVIHQVTLAVEPAYDVEQRVFQDIPWDRFVPSFEQIFGSAYSVSAFTRWTGDHVEQVWLKRRTDQPDRSAVLTGLGGRPATSNLHPIRELSAEACTPQLGEPGLWSDRLPHFRMDFTPSAGDEIQTEYFVALADAGRAITALRGIGDQLAEALLISEIRTVAADNIVLSPCFERDSVALHFTWGPDPEAARAASELVLKTLLPLEPRPHWGKVFPTGAALHRFSEPDVFESYVNPAFVNTWFNENVTDMSASASWQPSNALRHVGFNRIGLGTFGSDHVSADDVAAAVRTAIEAGYRYIDCASVYGNEAQIGEQLIELARQGHDRGSLFISSKVWNDQHHDVAASFEQSIADLRLGELNQLRRASMDPDALAGLPTDDPVRSDDAYLDLYLVHWPFPNHHPPHCDVDERNPEAVPYDHGRFIDTWRQMEELVDRGLVRSIGTSNMTISKLEPLLEDARIRPVVNQMELHPHFQQSELLTFCVRNDILPVGFCPLGSPARPERDRTPHDTSPMDDPVIVSIARSRGVHPAAICLMWAKQRGHVPIPFSTTPANIRANLNTDGLAPLSDHEMAEIASIDLNNRLIKGQVFLWPGATHWTDLWL